LVACKSIDGPIWENRPRCGAFGLA